MLNDQAHFRSVLQSTKQRLALLEGDDRIRPAISKLLASTTTPLPTLNSYVTALCDMVVSATRIGTDFTPARYLDRYKEAEDLIIWMGRDPASFGLRVPNLTE